MTPTEFEFWFLEVLPYCNVKIKQCDEVFEIILDTLSTYVCQPALKILRHICQVFDTNLKSLSIEEVSSTHCVVRNPGFDVVENLFGKFVSIDAITKKDGCWYYAGVFLAAGLFDSGDTSVVSLKAVPVDGLAVVVTKDGDCDDALTEESGGRDFCTDLEDPEFSDYECDPYSCCIQVNGHKVGRRFDSPFNAVLHCVQEGLLVPVTDCAGNVFSGLGSDATANQKAQVTAAWNRWKATF